jgi:hypothetical protein
LAVIKRLDVAPGQQPGQQSLAALATPGLRARQPGPVPVRPGLHLAAGRPRPGQGRGQLLTSGQRSRCAKACFFQSAQKFNTRYATLGFSDKANLDEGAMWPTTFALTELTAAGEARIGALVKKAVS